MRTLLYQSQWIRMIVLSNCNNENRVKETVFVESMTVLFITVVSLKSVVCALPCQWTWTQYFRNVRKKNMTFLNTWECIYTAQMMTKTTTTNIPLSLLMWTFNFCHMRVWKLFSKILMENFVISMLRKIGFFVVRKKPYFISEHRSFHTRGQFCSSLNKLYTS